MSGLPDEAFAAALAGLPAITPRRVAGLLACFGTAAAAWQAVLAGDPDARPGTGPAQLGDPQAWRRAAERCDVAALWSRCARLGLQVWVHGRPRYPAVLGDDLDPPPVLFARGHPSALDGRRVAVVGTRNATAPGRQLAFQLGQALAEAGIRVVSGLALGIDGAAHRGALDAGGAPVVGVVAAGLDQAYPPQHRRLHEQVAEHGLLLSEVPPGAPPLAWRFPLRNRVIAALADALVVVESRVTGGSMHTVREAQRRGVDVLAVPGSPLNAAAEGTNQLLRDGASPVSDVVDVLVALGLRSPGARPAPRCLPPDPLDRAVLACFGGTALHLDTVATLTGLDVVDAAVALGRLEAGGWVVRSGTWFEPVRPEPP